MSALQRQDIPVRTLLTCASASCPGAGTLNAPSRLRSAGGRSRSRRPVPHFERNRAGVLHRNSNLKGVYLCIS
jgi:hypothetical protein